MMKIKRFSLSHFIPLVFILLIFSVLPKNSVSADTPGLPSVTLGTNPVVHANGTALLIEEGSVTDSTTIYIDANSNGMLDAGEQSLFGAGIQNAPADSSDLSGWKVCGGASEAFAANRPYIGNTLVTMNGGKIYTLQANGTDAELTGNATLNISGGYIDSVSIGTYPVSGIKRINIKGSPVIRTLWVNECTNARATITGELTSGADIGVTCGSTQTVIAETAAGVNTSYADASKFRLTFLAGYHIKTGTGTTYALGTLYVMKNNYNITYQLGGGTAGQNAPASALMDDSFSVSAPSKLNCTFLGWKVNCQLYSSFDAFAKYGDASETVNKTLTYNNDTLYVNSVNPLNDVWFKNLNSVNGADVVLTAVWEEPVSGVRIDNTSPKAGDTLNAVTTPVNATVNYSWKVNGIEVGTQNSYCVTDADVGYAVNLTVSGTGNFTGSANAAPTAAVIALPKLTAPLTMIWDFYRLDWDIIESWPVAPEFSLQLFKDGTDDAHKLGNPINSLHNYYDFSREIHDNGNGTYYAKVKVKGDGVNFRDSDWTTSQGYIPFLFEDSPNFDIPAGFVGVPITAIDVSGSVSGGISPYTFTLENAPSWLSVTTDGVISGTPTSEAEATTARVVVTDSENLSGTISITINIGEIYAYKITKGENNEWLRGGGDGLSFTSNGEYNQFTGVEVDGNIISADKYTSQSGSTIVTLNAAYLETLKAGSHTLRLNFANGYAETVFTIQESSESPATGDNAKPWLLSLIAISAAAICLFIFKKKMI